MAPLDRPSIVPALDFESLAEKLAAADKAEAEAEAAEKASKGEVSTTASKRFHPLGCAVQSTAAFVDCRFVTTPKHTDGAPRCVSGTSRAASFVSRRRTSGWRTRRRLCRR